MVINNCKNLESESLQLLYHKKVLKILKIYFKNRIENTLKIPDNLLYFEIIYKNAYSLDKDLQKKITLFKTNIVNINYGNKYGNKYTELDIKEIIIVISKLHYCGGHDIIERDKFLEKLTLDYSKVNNNIYKIHIVIKEDLNLLNNILDELVLIKTGILAEKVNEIQRYAKKIKIIK